MAFVLHAEDRYNFNPGQAAIDTVFGIRVPDAVHGYLFEKTRSATPYTHYATLTGGYVGVTGSKLRSRFSL